MQELVGTGKSLVVIQSNFAQELLCLQSEGAWSGSAGLGGGIQSGAAICDRTAGLVVVYFSSLRRICVHVDYGGPGGLVVATRPHRLEASRRNGAEKFAGNAGQVVARQDKASQVANSTAWGTAWKFIPYRLDSGWSRLARVRWMCPSV